MGKLPTGVLCKDCKFYKRWSGFDACDNPTKIYADEYLFDKEGGKIIGCKRGRKK